MSFKSLESVDHFLSSFIPPPLSLNFSRYQDIIHSIHLARKPNLGLKSCDGNQELLNFLRSDLIEVATRLQKGGLGYVEETSEFEARVRPSGKYSWSLLILTCSLILFLASLDDPGDHMFILKDTCGILSSLCTYSIFSLFIICWFPEKSNSWLRTFVKKELFC